MSTQEKVRELIANNVKWSGSRSQLTDDYNLIDNHVLDSLDMLKVVSLLEEEFDLEVDDSELLPSNFGSVGQIAAFVDAKRG
jgi:acyl carrier protein